MTRKLKLLAVLMTLAAGSAWSAPATSDSTQTDDKVYRYTDPSGVIHYTDKPPHKDSKPVELPHLQTYRGKKSLAPRGPAQPPPPVIPKFELAINSPTPDQTVRSGSDIPVSVSVLPGLVDGYGLMYALDGTAQTESPIPETSFTLKGAERGEHTVAVWLVGPNNVQLATSSITVHMMPPTVKKPQ